MTQLYRLNRKLDGADLCSLLKDLGLGVSTETVEVVKPKRQFFEGI